VDPGLGIEAAAIEEEDDFRRAAKVPHAEVTAYSRGRSHADDYTNCIVSGY